MADLATAYLRLIPSLRGPNGQKLGKQIENELGGINTKSAGDKLGGGLGEGIKGGLGRIAVGNFLGNVLTQGVDMAVNAAVGTFQNAFENIGTFEQLSGGVEKIFDQANTEQIFKDAQNAYKDLNMSANEYLDSINQVGATFAQTMGDQRGYDTARQGMKAIADYASGTGRDLNELNDKYKLITRSASSYQSIADQFAGILPQTSKDFLAAAQGAGLLSTSYTELTQVPVAEYQEAVTKMLEQGVDKLGLLGNTAAESTGTLTGSIAMLQSSWQNLLTSFGDPNGDIEASIQAVVDSVGAVMQNAIPVIEKILSGMGQAIGNFAMQAGQYFMEHRTEIYDKVGQFIMEALKAIVSAIPYIIEGIAYLVFSIVEYIVTHLPEMAEAGVQILLALASGIVSVLSEPMKALEEAMNGALDGIASFFDDMVTTGYNLVTGLVNGILEAPGRIFEAITGIVGSAIDGAKQMLGIRSPSKVFEEIGRNTMLGLESGISGQLSAVGSLMRDVSSTMTADATFNANSTSTGGGVGGLAVYVTVESRSGEDAYDLGRQIGQATAYELRMQGVSA